MKLLFVTSNRIGDAVLSTGLLNHMLREHPDMHTTVACGPDPAPLFTETLNLDRIIVMEKQPRAKHWRALWRETVRTRWDLVVDLRASALSYFLWAGERHVFRPSDEPVHQVVQLSQFLGLEQVVSPGLWLGQKQVTAAKRAIPPGPPILAVGPTTNWPGKQWPASRFAELILRLIAPGAILEDARVAVIGADSERLAARPLLERIPKERRLDWIGKFDILTAAAALQECVFYIGNDSGLMHIAAATYTPTLGLFGPSREEIYAPWGTRCAFVRTKLSYEELAAMPQFNPARRETLMGSLAVEAVEAAAVDLWRRCHPEPATQVAGGAL
jgi:ADP-heptose:LPS heptosyltransferase